MTYITIIYYILCNQLLMVISLTGKLININLFFFFGYVLQRKRKKKKKEKKEKKKTDFQFPIVYVLENEKKFGLLALFFFTKRCCLVSDI